MLGLEIERRGKLHPGSAFTLPECGDVYFVTLRSSYPLAGCSPAEPASVLLDGRSLEQPGAVSTRLRNCFGELARVKNT